MTFASLPRCRRPSVPRCVPPRGTSLGLARDTGQLSSGISFVISMRCPTMSAASLPLRPLRATLGLPCPRRWYHLSRCRRLCRLPLPLPLLLAIAASRATCQWHVAHADMRHIGAPVRTAAGHRCAPLPPCPLAITMAPWPFPSSVHAGPVPRALPSGGKSRGNSATIFLSHSASASGLAPILPVFLWQYRVFRRRLGIRRLHMLWDLPLSA